LGVETFASHIGPLEEAPLLYRAFQEKKGNVFKALLKPHAEQNSVVSS